MKIPKKQRKHCPECGTHTEHTVRKESTKPTRTLSKGQRKRNEGRKGYGNSGRYSKSPSGGKPTEKVDLRYECDECGNEKIIGKGFRAKRIEIER